LRDRKAAEEARKDREFNQWKLYQSSGRTLQDAQMFEPADYELQPCDGEGTASCTHPRGYHAYMREEEKKKKEKNEKEKGE
jgi:hypothetical protein